MLGAIAGDIIGSAYEQENIRSADFPLFTDTSTFTDDTILIMAIASAILHEDNYAQSLKHFGRKYPRPKGGYGHLFQQWLKSESAAPNLPGSWGAGSAVMVCAVGIVFHTASEVLEEAKKCAEVTHNHLEGIKGAQATALAIFLARTGKSKPQIKQEISERFGYDLDSTPDEISTGQTHDESCQGMVPKAIKAFLASENFEDAIRKAVSLGGYSSTLAAITGAIAQAHYKFIPETIVVKVISILPKEFRKTLERFSVRYGGQSTPISLPLREERILLTDDSETIGLVQRRILNEAGYINVDLGGHNGNDVLKTFSPGKYAVIVTDFKKPGINGIEMLRKIRQQDPLIQFIICSASLSREWFYRHKDTHRKEEHDLIREIGVSDILSKPFLYHDFLNSVNRAVMHHYFIKTVRWTGMDMSRLYISYYNLSKNS
ncbi:MAG: response regulator [Chlorobiales bacterium]|jgi:ADP-ribosylglycohydrolase/CheY-like chemotaxis protein|nr:response regulator [Chlorobiales bacterium]